MKFVSKYDKQESKGQEFKDYKWELEKKVDPKTSEPFRVKKTKINLPELINSHLEDTLTEKYFTISKETGKLVGTEAFTPKKAVYRDNTKIKDSIDDIEMEMKDIRKQLGKHERDGDIYFDGEQIRLNPIPIKKKIIKSNNEPKNGQNENNKKEGDNK